MSGKARTALAVVAVIVLGTAAASHVVAAEKNPSDLAFERLKSLVGTWETIDKETKRPGVATYTLTGGGKVLIETMGGMATAYHFDKGTLVLTHYCGAGNQPRMRAKTVDGDGRRIAFEMYDITNHPNADSYYSSALDVRFAENGTVELTYRGMTAGRESTQTFQLVKRLSSSATR
jgi:hypothetical protein